ncbi:permease, partial [Microcystis aeruginosa]
MSQLQNAFTLFLSLLVEAMPFLLLGVILSSILLIFVDERRLVALMPRNAVLGAFVGGCIGFLFPVCECGNVPVARRLLVQGMPNAVAVSFLLAAPTINPIVIWSTWVAFRDQPEIVFYRVIFSLFIATVIGIIFSIQKDPRP